MSVFLCPDATFDYLEAAARNWDVRVYLRESDVLPDWAAPLIETRLAPPWGGVTLPQRVLRGDWANTNFGLVARLLHAENVRSVCHRYPDSGDDMVGRYTGRTLSSIISFWGPLNPVWVLKTANCLDYQSRETDDWRETVAFRLLEGIRDEAVSRLPGYEAAPWGLDASDLPGGFSPVVLQG